MRNATTNRNTPNASETTVAALAKPSKPFPGCQTHEQSGALLGRLPEPRSSRTAGPSTVAVSWSRGSGKCSKNAGAI